MNAINNNDVRRTVKFEMFRGTLTTWNTLFQEAADFASEVGPDRVISVSHSSNGEGVVTVWYWE